MHIFNNARRPAARRIPSLHPAPTSPPDPAATALLAPTWHPAASDILTPRWMVAATALLAPAWHPTSETPRRAPGRISTIMDGPIALTAAASGGTAPLIAEIVAKHGTEAADVQESTAAAAADGGDGNDRGVAKGATITHARARRPASCRSRASALVRMARKHTRPGPSAMP